MKWLDTPNGLVNIMAIKKILQEDNKLVAVLMDGERVLLGEYTCNDDALDALTFIRIQLGNDIIDCPPDSEACALNLILLKSLRSG
ncbi:hypothetical protein SAMN02746089_02658 [Caldanaerobius fijiensis DSM 17918]|uniref:Uncharacterized protein n=1 Tax=Caldanaerobius fijiensis DSM 17918 TaxID=1121256 RepID=A0A1M5F0I1_9THEO|nr:hypothetical protein [Caldanaerobius fijiensis]SHF84928.1 hypothetical protein SAMN02746089_02658 [Caldanaerobius fijiensis DSM 17918]